MKLTTFMKFAAVALTLGTANPSLAETQITIATDGAYAPWSFQDASGKLQGFDIDIANDLCERMKASCTIVAQDFDGLIPSLMAGKFDTIIAALGITDKRKESIDFSRPYANTKAGFFARKGSPMSGLADGDKVYSLTAEPDKADAAVKVLKEELKGKVIGVQTASTLADFVDANFKDIVDLRLYKSLPEAMLDLESDRIDGVFGADAALAAMTSQPKYADYQMVGPKFIGGIINQGIALGLKKGNTELKGKLDEAIASAMADGTVAKLATKWFAVDLTPLE